MIVKGEIDTEGTLVFQGSRGKVPLRHLVVKTQATPLIAKVGGCQLKLAASHRLSSQRSGFGTDFQANQLKLTAKVITRLNKKLRPKLPFKANQPLGSLSSHAEPRVTTILAQGKATLALDEAFVTNLDEAFVTKMDEHFVSINPIFPAEHQGLTFTLPIIGGGQVFWHEQWLEVAEGLDSAEVDLEPIPAFAGKIGRQGVLGAAPFSLIADPFKRTISGSGIGLALTAQSAKAFDEAFAAGKEDFKVGEAVGALGFAAQGQ